jgi:hypothetical protein
MRMERPRSAGGFYVVGNDVTYNYIFLDRLALSPGQCFTEPDLRQAEQYLAPLRWLGISCSVTALDREGDSKYADILVRVKETPITRILSPIYQTIDLRVQMLLGK